jgi:hypothetical protein
MMKNFGRKHVQFIADHGNIVSNLDKFLVSSRMKIRKLTNRVELEFLNATHSKRPIICEGY